jgi:DNA-binding LacI/PurR family transcriptional regulator/DNA-binding transcriptional regulator YhcF (GntR family)
MSLAIKEVMAWIWSQGWLQGHSQVPSARQLAQACGVSVRQVLRALHEFEGQGMLKIRAGGSIQVISQETTSTPPVEPKAPAQKSVVGRIRDGIAEGRFRVGEPLPKATWLCLDWHISTRVLASACRQLGQENLLRKQGKSWVVGAPSVEKAQATSLTRRAILVVCNRPGEWAEFHGNLVDDMARTIEMEANRLGVRLVPVLTGVEPVAKVFPLGKIEIRRCVQELGESLCGILLTPLFEDLPDFDEWCKWLSRFHVPVVWMQDYHPARPLPSVPERFYRISYGAWVDPDMLTEADFALQALHAKGHREIAFACNDLRVYHWFRLRDIELKKRAEILGMTVHCIESDVSDQALMQRVLDLPGVTALLAPNDRYAVRYWQVLAELGVRIPRDLSMVSFDNLADLHPFPISSVDFGLATLGYKAFHLLLGDVPVQVAKGNHLMGICQLVDRGSIGKPRQMKRLKA